MEYSLGQRVGLDNKIKRVSVSNVINTDHVYTVYKDGIPFLEVTARGDFFWKSVFCFWEWLVE